MTTRSEVEAELLSRLYATKGWDPIRCKWVYRVEFENYKGNTLTLEQYDALGGKHLPNRPR